MNGRYLRPAAAAFRLATLLGAVLLAAPRPADAHPAPFSFLDLLIDDSGMRGSLIVHDLDAAHDLGVDPADRLLDQAVADSYRAQLEDLLSELGLHPRLIIVEHNREILDREKYGAVEVKEGDTLELVHFVGGG